MFDSGLQRLWYGRSAFALLLLPIAALFIAVAAIRRVLFRCGIFRSTRVSKPVIVVGNITVGGTGKTPLVIWLAQSLRNRGYVPGIVARGYGGTAHDWPREVAAASDPKIVGDEPALLAMRAGGIVVAGPNRVSAAERAIELGATVIISDDGLQHYALSRDFEIAVVDGVREFGNGWRLPAGPLRESIGRLRNVDAVIRNYRGVASNAKRTPLHTVEFATNVRLADARSLSSGEVRSLQSFSGTTVHAIAGIGNPQAFFDGLRAFGMQVVAHPFPDHALLTAADLKFTDDRPILMTEKDAVKCRAFADQRCWAVPLEMEFDRGAELLDAITRKLDSAAAAAHSARTEKG